MSSGTGLLPAPLSSRAIRDYAERVGEHHGIYDQSGCADLDVLLQKLGGTVAYRDGAESSHVRAPKNFTIFLPHFTSQRRDRFTISHELGHYFLHYLLPKKETEEWFGRGERSSAETQANVFASALLMPEAPFSAAWMSSGGDEWAMSRQFNVSPAAASVRAQVLGLDS